MSSFQLRLTTVRPNLEIESYFVAIPRKNRGQRLNGSRSQNLFACPWCTFLSPAEKKICIESNFLPFGSTRTKNLIFFPKSKFQTAWLEDGSCCSSVVIKTSWVRIPPGPGLLCSPLPNLSVMCPCTDLSQKCNTYYFIGINHAQLYSLERNKLNTLVRVALKNYRHISILQRFDLILEASNKCMALRSSLVVGFSNRFKSIYCGHLNKSRHKKVLMNQVSAWKVKS